MTRRLPPALRLAILLAASPLTAATITELTVAPDGDPDFHSVQEAVDAVPAGSEALHLIRIAPGTYEEVVRVAGDKGPVKLLGAGPGETVIRFDNHASRPGPDGEPMGTFASATVFVHADDFAAENITFENSHGQGSQALAIHVSGDRAVFRDCRFLGWQDTVLAREGRQYFENCRIEGHVDFIFGGATAFFEDCDIVCRGNGYITAASTPEDQPYGFVFRNCRIRGADPEVRTYLGRPWRPHGSVAVVECELGAVVRPEGWHNWGDPAKEFTARYAEQGNSGPGAASDRRVPWMRPLPPAEARALYPKRVFHNWDPAHAVSLERIARLPPGEREAWLEYLRRSAAFQRGDRRALAAELADTGLDEAIKPPSGGQFRVRGRTWLATDEALQLARVVLSYQTPSGGWSKSVDYRAGPRPPGTQWSPSASPTNWHYVGTFDNGSTTTQLRLLAGVYSAAGGDELREAFGRGLEYLLAAQYPNGGWPQGYPLEGGYHDNITFNDGAMIHVLELLRDIGAGETPYGFVGSEDRERCRKAVDRGVACILAAQVPQDGRPSVWGAQQDPLEFDPAPARYMEPRSLSGGESVGVVEFLMDLEEPTEPVETAIADALDWFDRSRLSGVRRAPDVGPMNFVGDPSDTTVYWARFYDVESNRPLFASNRNGFVYSDFESMANGESIGYNYYIDDPARLFER